MSAKKGELVVRNIDRESRKRAVLTATINKYISLACPVASEDIACDFDLSSATIRSIFAESEESGYLAHPYTSGGRIPTDKGYRYYVDFLIAQIELLDEEKQRIVKEYQHKIKRLEDILEETSEVISQITRYAGIVSFLDWHDKFFYKGISRVLEQPEFHDFDKLRLLIGILEDKQQLLDIVNRDFSEKVKVYIGSELGLPDMGNCSLVVSSFQHKNKTSGRVAVLGPARMEYRHIIPTMEYISGVLSDALAEL
jgi:transcriptional regulator of heat shock response